MPHQCTNCERTFDDGSKEMLSGCPNCGGNKFQFKPDGADDVDASAEPPEPPEPTSSSSVAQTVGRTAATVKDLMSGGSDDRRSTSSPTTGSEPTGGERGTATVPEQTPSDREDTAQASARSDVISPDELPSEPATEDAHHFQPVSTDETTTQSSDRDDQTDEERPSAAEREAGKAAAETGEQASTTDDAPAEPDRPDLKELREELNDQFESIKVLQPGQYELNLLELYDREEYIVALQEDGRYSIQVPENFREST